MYLGANLRRWAATPALVAVVALAVVACGDEQPLCLPEPSVRCVSNVALAVVDAANEAEPFPGFLSASTAPLVDLAKALRKLNDAQGLTRLAEVAKRIPAGLNPLGTVVLLGQTGEAEAARAAVRRSLTKDAEHYRTRIEKGELGFEPLSDLPEILVRAGLADDARALLKGWIDRETPLLAKLPAEKRIDYLTDAVRAFALIGERDAARGYGEQSAQAIEAAAAGGSQLVTHRLALAKALIGAGHPDPAIEQLRKAGPGIAAGDSEKRRREQSFLAQRLMVTAQRARKDDAGYAAARDGLRALRLRAVAAFRVEAVDEVMGDDFETFRAAGDLDEARRIRDEAQALLAQPPGGEEPSDSATSALATMQAALGDEEGAVATVRKIKDDPTDWKIPAKIAGLCGTLSANGHTAAALRCAARLTDRRNLWQIRRLETYARIAADLAAR
jgi:hypothetical protein